MQVHHARMRNALPAIAILLPSCLAAPAAAQAHAWALLHQVPAPRPVAGAFGAAISLSEGRLWVGPSRDLDVGEGPPQVWALDLSEVAGRVAANGVPAGGNAPWHGADPRTGSDPRTGTAHGAIAGANGGVGGGRGDVFAAALPVPPAAAIDEPKLDRRAGFGLAVAAAGDMCVVGAPHWGCLRQGCDMGQAYLVSSDHAVDGAGAGWRLDEIACPEPEPASEFGAAIAFDGATLVVASPRADAGANDSGAVDIYRVGPAPGRNVTHVVRLRAPHPQRSAHFGASVAVSGDWIAIGEPGFDGATANEGAVHMALRTSEGWRIQASLRAPAGAVGWYGASVALAGVDLLIGAPTARREHAPESVPSARGSVVRAALLQGHWRATEVLCPGRATEANGFGQALALHAPWAIVGAPGDDALGEATGSAWVLDLNTNRMLPLRPAVAKPGQRFGAGVTLGFTRAVPGGLPPRLIAAVANGHDPERPMAPGEVSIYGPVTPARAFHSGAAQSMSASAIAIAADASVTTAGAQPSCAARSCASGP